MNRATQIDRAKKEHFQVCIIGGGITAAGVLYHAVAHGYKTILIERNDFASGTSSRSSKMIHGGLRYLKNFQLKLVHEALHEREHLLNLFPHLVKPAPYVLPSFGSRLGLLFNNIGLSLYDLLAGKSVMSKHQKLSVEKTLEYLPNFISKDLVGSIMYWDAQTNDAKLVIEVISECAKRGASALNYCKLTRFEKNESGIKSAVCKDVLNGEMFEINASIFINATGVWTDEVLEMSDGNRPAVMKPSKGVHVIVPTDKMPPNAVAVLKTINRDNRFIYNLPWENNLTILGTTDTEYAENINQVISQKEDVDYILETFNHYFPTANFTYDDVVAVYAGLRPMLSNESVENSSKQSREYKIWWSHSNLLNIAGGKLTSFLSMGNHCMTMAMKRLKKPENKPQNGTLEQSEKWAARYGNSGVFIDEIIDEDASFENKFFPDFDYSIAEILFFIRHQFAQTLDDVLSRRTHISYSMKIYDETLVLQLATFMAKELNRNEDWINAELTAYKEIWQQYHPQFLKK